MVCVFIIESRRLMWRLWVDVGSLKRANAAISLRSVFLAKAGIHPHCRLDDTLEMDHRLRGDDRLVDNLQSIRAYSPTVFGKIVLPNNTSIWINHRTIVRDIKCRLKLRHVCQCTIDSIHCRWMRIDSD